MSQVNKTPTLPMFMFMFFLLGFYCRWFMPLAIAFFKFVSWSFTVEAEGLPFSKAFECLYFSKWLWLKRNPVRGPQVLVCFSFTDGYLGCPSAGPRQSA